MRHPSSDINNLKRIIFSLLVGLLINTVPHVYASSVANLQEAKVNQKKIDKERAKKEKEGQKQYEKAVKKHMDNQSKETKAMMKQAKKDSKKNTPVK
jgi:hypothetical protein